MITASKMAKCQKQKISGYIFVVLFLVAHIEATETEDILDPDLAEGLVALQPVLKDHIIDYRHAFFDPVPLMSIKNNKHSKFFALNCRECYKNIGYIKRQLLKGTF